MSETIFARNIKSSPLEQALDHFVHGRGTPESMAVIGRESKIEAVQIHVRLRRPPRPGPIALPFKGAPHGGPLSIEGREVVHVEGPRYGGVYAAWWRAEDLRREPVMLRRKRAKALAG